MMLCSKGQVMVKNGHVDAAMIEKKTTQLTARWAELKDGASLRRLRLQDALESHQVIYHINLDFIPLEIIFEFFL